VENQRPKRKKKLKNIYLFKEKVEYSLMKIGGNAKKKIRI
jgi:hypothetical protein